MGCLKAIIFCILMILSFGNLKAYSIEEQGRSSAPGMYANPADVGMINKITFSSKQPVVATYLFYWYNHDTREAFYDGEGKDILTHHPVESDGYSWANPDWYYREFKDMMAAGIDVVLPVYWGYPDFRDNWSFWGLAPLVKAQERMLKEGLTHPKNWIVLWLCRPYVKQYGIQSGSNHNKRQRVALCKHPGLLFIYPPAIQSMYRW